MLVFVKWRLGVCLRSEILVVIKRNFCRNVDDVAHTLAKYS